MPHCTPIGTVRTPFTTLHGTPRQGAFAEAIGEIHLEPKYVRGLTGVEPDMEIDVLWYADRADRTVLEVERGGQRGVFMSRSQDRPNPVCITRCDVLAVEGARIKVRGVDMLDGTPALDLKPPLYE